MAGEIKYTELDFNQIKDNLKNFLKSQEKFKDYDFDGAGLSILLDLLAYNTAYNGFYLNMLASEMFLDSAQLRPSVVSRAKHLGYTPRSAKSARAIVDIEIFPTSGTTGLDPSPSEIFVDRSTKFYSTVNNKAHIFSPVESFTIVPDNARYLATDVELIEGMRLTHRWTHQTTSPLKPRYIIPNANVDLSTLTVQVQTSTGNLSKRTFLPHKDFNEVTPESVVYFLHETDNNLYEISFGDGVVGVPLQEGNVIIAEYVVASTEDVTGVSSISPVEKIQGYLGVRVTTKVPAHGYVAPESVDSIKYLAPLNYEAQNRAVTQLDYETLIKKDAPNIEFLRVWGGEENDPPYYGKVFMAVKPKTGLALSADQKNALITQYIRPRNLISLEVEIVEPDYLGVMIQSVVNYKGTVTALTEIDIRNLVISKIKQFASEELNGFDADFRYSRLVKYIDDAHYSIDGNLTNISMRYRFYPPFGVNSRFDIKLNNSIDRGDSANNISSITSSGFVFRGATTHIGDDGQGKMNLYRIIDQQKIIIDNNIGTVDYDTGKIIVNLEVQSIQNDISYIDLYIVPRERNVNALRSQLLIILESDIVVNVNDITKT